MPGQLVTDQPPLTHIIQTTHMKFSGHAACASPLIDHSQAFWTSVAPLLHGTSTTNQAHHATPASEPLNQIWHHSTLVWQLPITDCRIDKYGARS